MRSPSAWRCSRSASVSAACSARLGIRRWKAAGPRSARSRTAWTSAGVAAVSWATTSTSACVGCGLVARLGRVLARQAEVGDDDDDRAQEERARHGRPEAEAAVRARLREVVAEGRAERPGEDVGDPERGDGVQVEAVVRDPDRADRRREQDERDEVAEVQPLGGQVARRGTEGEREQDGEPVEALAPRRVDRVDRQRPLARVPDGERDRERDREHDRRDHERHAHVVASGCP